MPDVDLGLAALLDSSVFFCRRKQIAADQKNFKNSDHAWMLMYMTCTYKLTPE